MGTKTPIEVRVKPEGDGYLVEAFIYQGFSVGAERIAYFRRNDSWAVAYLIEDLLRSQPLRCDCGKTIGFKLQRRRFGDDNQEGCCEGEEGDDRD